jgi:hypothetical protein
MFCGIYQAIQQIPLRRIEQDQPNGPRMR